VLGVVIRIKLQLVQVLLFFVKRQFVRKAEAIQS
jgi:hypothetical protein